MRDTSVSNQVRDAIGGAHKRRVLLFALIVAVAAAAVGLPASGGNAKQVAAPKGAPIKVMTVTTIESQTVPPFENIAVAAKAYEKWVNKRGGIAGRPLQVTICDDRGDPTVATACARKAVQAKMVAVVGSFTFFGEAVVPVLLKANTAWGPICCAQSDAELKSTNVFTIGGQPTWASGMVARAYEDGCKKINSVIVDGGQGVYKPLLDNAAKAYGHEIGKTIIIPPNGKDFSPQVAEATSGGVDCAMMVFGESTFQAWMPAWAQSGTKVRMYGVQGNLDEKSMKGFEKESEGSVIVNTSLDLSAPEFKDMRTALAEYKAPSRLDYNALGSLGGWTAYTAFKSIVEKMKGPITNKTFLAAAKKAKSVDTKGLTPKIDFTHPWMDAPNGWIRLFNCGVAFNVMKNGKSVPLTTALQDVTQVAKGIGKMPPASSEGALCGVGR